MERVKKRKLKFPCLIRGNNETLSPRSVESCSPANHTTEQSLPKFKAGKSTSKKRKGNRMKKLFTKKISNRISSKKRSPSILVKLMRRGRLSYKTIVLKKKTKNVDGYSDQCTKNTQHFESGKFGLYRYDYHVDESLHVLRSGYVSESEEITVSFRIIFDQHDRLTHSLSYMSESSLIMDSAYRMLERFNTTHIKEDVGTVNTVSMLRETPSLPYPDKETKHTESVNVMDLVGVINTSGSTSLQSSFIDPNHESDVFLEDDVDEKVYNELTNQDRRRKVQKDIFNHEEDIPSQYVRSQKRSQTSLKSSVTNRENEDPAKYHQSPVSDNDVDDQLSGPESEDAAFHSDCFESVNSRLQDLKKNLHLLKVGSKLSSNKLTLTPKVKHIGQLSPVSLSESVSRESAYMAHILQTLENDVIAPDTSSSSWNSEITHPPIDPRLFYFLEKYYFDETVLLRNEKRLFYDYIEQMFIRNSKSTVAYPWVNPVKRESQLRLPKSSLENQIRNVVVEIEKDEDEDFFAIYIDNDSEWMQPMNEVGNLGKLIAELILNYLLLEVVDL